MAALSGPTASHHRSDRDPAMDGTDGHALEIHITGRRGHGKSTLIRALADHWGSQGRSVLTITSTTPAADTGQWRRTATGYQTVLPLMGHADIVLIECDWTTHPTAHRGLAGRPGRSTAVRPPPVDQSADQRRPVALLDRSARATQARYRRDRRVSTAAGGRDGMNIADTLASCVEPHEHGRPQEACRWPDRHRRQD